ncbi:MAG: ADOP family duplicated permease [Gemmatimonadota bacterium]
MSERLPNGIRRLLRISSVDRDLDEELAAHFQYTIDELVSRGYTHEAAQQEAFKRFGDWSSYRRDLRTIDRGAERQRRWSDRLDALRQSVGYAVRSLARSPGLAIGIILTFALGIGANAIMYGIVERLLLSAPPHITDADQVKRLYLSYYSDAAGKRIINSTFSYPEFREMRTARGFSGVAGFSTNDVVIGKGEAAEEGLSMSVTGDFFEVLGVKPSRGRFFRAEEDRIGGPQQAVISYGYWQRKFAGAPAAIGQTLDFGYGKYTIVGIAPRGFTGPELQRIDFWIPLHVAAPQLQGNGWQDDRGWGWFELAARLRPGVSVAAATDEATALNAAGWAPDIAKGSYGKDPGVIVAPVLPALGPLAGGESVVARLLLGVSLLVLLIACVNVANLMLARTIRQTREIAVRLSLGISRIRLVAQILLEGVLLSATGGAAALACFKWGGAFVRTALLPDVAWDDAGLTRGVVLLIIFVALMAGLIAAAVPAMRAARGELGAVLRLASAGGVTRTTSRVRTTLALLQTTLSVLLLVGAGLFVRSLVRIHQSDLGFDAQGLYQITPRTAADQLGPDRVRVFGLAAERLARIPGVQAVGITESYPFLARRTAMPRAEGVDSIQRPLTGSPLIQQVSAGYFEAMGLRILRGRPIRDSDSEGAPRVALVNQSLARWIWGEQDPIGKCLYVGRAETRCSEVIGVVENAVHSEIGVEPPVQYYTPVAQRQLPPFHAHRLFVVRVNKPTAAIESAMRRAVVSADSRIRFAQVQSMEDQLAQQTRSWTLGATMFTVFGLLALIVAALGLYSVLAFDVAQRSREIGVRAALGATRNRLIGMVVSRAVRVTAIGVTAGILIAVLSAGRLQPLLFGVSARDPTVYAVVALILVLVAAVAGAMPGWRAAGVDPTTALRG